MSDNDIIIYTTEDGLSQFALREFDENSTVNF